MGRIKTKMQVVDTFITRLVGERGAELPDKRTAHNYAAIAQCGCAPRKIENESPNVLKNCGYHVAHNFGPGQP